VLNKFAVNIAKGWYGLVIDMIYVYDRFKALDMYIIILVKNL
jgi:hypothetical protein